jgi:hypothetical protein
MSAVSLRNTPPFAPCPQPGRWYWATCTTLARFSCLFFLPLPFFSNPCTCRVVRFLSQQGLPLGTRQSPREARVRGFDTPFTPTPPGPVVPEKKLCTWRQQTHCPSTQDCRRQQVQGAPGPFAVAGVLHSTNPKPGTLSRVIFSPSSCWCSSSCFLFWGAEQTCRGFSVYQGKVYKRTERLMWRMPRQEGLRLAEQSGRRGIVLRSPAPARHGLEAGDYVAMFPVGGTGAEEGAWAARSSVMERIPFVCQRPAHSSHRLFKK